MNSWQLWIGLALIIVSVVIYYIQILIFQNPHDTFFYLLQDFAFVPMQILFITLLVNEVLSWREKKALLKKMNMLIGVFFSEVGTELAKICSQFDCQSAELKNILLVNSSWKELHYHEAANNIKQRQFHMDAHKGDLGNLQQYLLDKRPFMTALLANPNLLEHETFTELMWAVMHLTEELSHRSDISQLPKADYAHMEGDIERVYALLVQEWLAYMNHLQTDYPYLFSLAIRNNPFDENASIIFDI